MRRFLQASLAALGICCGCSESDLLPPTQFTNEFAQELRKGSHGLKVEVVREMELKVATTDGRGCIGSNF